jgi:SAM-dependent methyltransferase
MSVCVQSTLAGTHGDRAEVLWETAGCPLCGGRRWIAMDDAPVFLWEDRRCTAVVCQGCGTCFTTPRPTAATIHRFYGNYEPHSTCGLSAAERRKQLGPRRRWKFWKYYHPQRHGLPLHGKGRLLDFGCGAGAYLEMMHRQGWQVVGLDVCAEVVERIRTELRLTALTGTLPHAELPPESFDVVTMWHSLEHVYDPVEVLRHVWRVLAPGGKLVLGVPNVGGAPRRWFGRSWYGWSLPHHLTHFTPHTLRQAVEHAGFQVDDVRLPGNPFWLRASAEAACRQDGGKRWGHALRNRWLSRQAANYLQWAGRSDEMVMTAVKPADATITPPRKYVRLSSLTQEQGQAGKPDVPGSLACRGSTPTVPAEHDCRVPGTLQTCPT